MSSYFLAHSATHIAQSIYKEFGHPKQIYIVSNLDPQDKVISAVTRALDTSISQQYTLHIISKEIFLHNPRYNPIMVIQKDENNASNIDNMNLIPIKSSLISRIDESNISNNGKIIKIRYRSSPEKYILGIPQNSYNHKLSQRLMENTIIGFE